MPKISVLMPFYNCERTLAEAIESILSQTVEDFEFILVNDGCTDGSAALAQSYAAKDSRIQLVGDDHNRGLVERLNQGVALCRGNFFARMDGDDWSFPRRFAAQLDYLEAHKSIVAVSSAHIHIDGEGVITGAHTPNLNGENDQYEIPAREPYLPHPFLMTRTQIIKNMGGYRHVLHAEDADICWRLIEFGSVRNSSCPLGMYRIHDNSVSARSEANGRLQATYSQIAAISAQRRFQGQQDFDLNRKLAIGAVSHSTSFSDLTNYLSTKLDLTQDEKNYLVVASVTKYLQFATWRPWSLESHDVRFARMALELGQKLAVSATSYRNIRHAYKSTLKSLRQSSQPVDALRFLSLRVQLSKAKTREEMNT